jgi:hypothetical protein
MEKHWSGAGLRGGRQLSAASLAKQPATPLTAETSSYLTSASQTDHWYHLCSYEEVRSMIQGTLTSHPPMSILNSWFFGARTALRSMLTSFPERIDLDRCDMCVTIGKKCLFFRGHFPFYSNESAMCFPTRVEGKLKAIFGQLGWRADNTSV